MKIKTVRYRRLQSHDRGYGHDAVEAEAHVEEGEDSERVFEDLKAWVLHRLDGLREIDRHIDRLDHLRHEVKRQEETRDRVAAEVKRGREIIREHEKLAGIAKREGLDAAAEKLLDDGVPF